MSRFVRVSNRYLCLLLLAGFILCTSSTARAAVIIDAAGDTFGTGVHDIASVSTEVAGTDLIVTASFFNTISPGSAFAPDSVYGFIDLDTDQNAATGNISTLDIFGFGVPGGLGVEFYIDIFADIFHPGDVHLLGPDLFTFIADVPITFAATSFSVTIPLSLLGGDDGNVNFAAIMGGFPDPTDQVPNGVAAVPEPASFSTFLGMGLIAMVAVGWRKRRKCVSQTT